jgi:hypothetical protein
MYYNFCTIFLGLLFFFNGGLCKSSDKNQIKPSIEYLNINSPMIDNKPMSIFNDLYIYINETTGKKEFISISDRGNTYVKHISLDYQNNNPKIFTFDDKFNMISSVELQIRDKYYSVFNIDTINPEGIIKINNELCIISDESHESLVYISCQNGNIIKRYLPKTVSNYDEKFKSQVTYPISYILPNQKNSQENKGIEAIAYDKENNILYYMYQSEPVDSNKILFVEINLNKDYSIDEKKIKTYDYLISDSDYEKLDKKSDKNFNSNDQKKVKISSMSIFNNDIYISETYHNILMIYKINIDKINIDKKNKIKKELYFSNVFPKEEKIEGFAMDKQNIYLGLDTDFLTYEYNLIKIKPN